MGTYFEVVDNTIVNVVDCDAEFAEANGLIDIPESAFPSGGRGRGAVLVEGVWRDMPKADKEVQVRQFRQNTLEHMIDPVVSNPLRWAALSVAQQNEVKRIRQALLDMPTQPDWPWCLFPVWDQNVTPMDQEDNGD